MDQVCCSDRLINRNVAVAVHSNFDIAIHTDVDVAVCGYINVAFRSDGRIAVNTTIHDAMHIDVSCNH